MADTALAPTPVAPTSGQKFSAEVLGTFVLVFFGVGTALATSGEVITTGLAFGLTVLVMAYAMGRISGGHFNPAVTVGAALGGRLAWSHTPLYIGGQLLGALVGGSVLWGIWHGFDGFSSDGNFGQNSFGDYGSGIAWWAALLVEAVMTFVFVMVILAVTDERNEHPALAPLAIGLALAMIHFASIRLTGTSVNPARSIGANIFAGKDAIIQLWLFIVAPLLGAAIAGIVYPALFGHASDPVPGSGMRLRRAVQPGVPGYGAPDAYQQQWNQQYPPQQPWPPQPPQQWQQPQYPTGQPGPQAWPQQPPVQPQQPQQPQPGQPGQPPQAAPPQQPWPANDGEDGQTQVRPPT